MKRVVTCLLVLAMIFAAAGCGGASRANQITIGGKNFTEQDILVYIMKDLLEAKTKLKVQTKPFLGGTNVVAQALERGDLDLYAEYTGTALINLLNQPPMTNPQAVYDKVKQIYRDQKNLIWLQPLGFNNTYTLAMRADRAQELGIVTYSDLAKRSASLVLGATQEFLERPDGYKGLQQVYGGLNFESTKGMDPGLTYAAVRDGQVDVNDAFATDGRIVAFNLRILKDDKDFFPPYYAAPVVRKETLDKHPEIANVLGQLAGRLDDKKMAELNSKVDLEGRDAKQVARDWLKAEGFIQ